MVNISAFPVIAEFLPYHINEGYDGGRFSLMKNGMQNITYPNKKTREIIQAKIKGFSPVFENKAYKIYIISNIVVVCFSKNN